MAVMARALVSALVLVLGSLPGPATAAEDALAGSCRGMNVMVPAGAETVRRLGQVPARWKLALDEEGRATVALDAAVCTFPGEGQARTVVWSRVAALLDSSAIPAPEHDRSTSNVAGLPMDFYLLSWSTDDRAFLEWLREGTGLEGSTRYVPDLALDAPMLTTPSLGLFHDLRFVAPQPEPSPYSFTASTTDPVTPVVPLVLNVWRETPAGSVMVESNLVGAMGTARQWQVDTHASSPLAQMIGSSTYRFVCDPALLVSPLLARLESRAAQGCLGAGTFPSATLRRGIS